MTGPGSARRIGILSEEPNSEATITIKVAMEALGFDLASYLTLAQLMRCARNEHCAAYVFQSDASAERARSMHQWRNDWLATDTPLIAYGPDSALQTAAQLDAGADEYLRVPTHGAELAARLRGALRHRIKVHESEELRVGGCIVESRTTSLVSESAKVPLTAREYRVARLLFENAGAMVSCDKFAEDVWGLSKELSKRSIEQHIYQLRRKLRACVGDAIVLRSIYGGGYRLESGEPGAGPRK